MTAVAVSVIAMNAVTPGHSWSSGLDDLILEATEPVIADRKIDALFVACPTAILHSGQAGVGAMVADRLALDCAQIVALDAAEASAAAALDQAVRAIQSGQSATALVIGGAKLSDLGESERLAVLDRGLDYRADQAAGTSYAGQSSLWAQLAMRDNGLRREALAELAAEAYRNHAHMIGTRAVGAAEILKDMEFASPLRRSEFARLQDGAFAVLLAAPHVEAARHASLQILDVGFGCDTLSLWDRRDPLRLASIERALGRLPSLPGPLHFELDNSSAALHYFIRDELERQGLLVAERGNPSAGGASENIGGGVLGAGLVYGCAALTQLHHVVTHREQIKTDRVISVATGGLGAISYLFHLALEPSA